MPGITDNNKLDQPVNENLTSGANIPFWFDQAEKPINYGKLKNDLTTDTLVIGGGISGLSVAYCLALKGRKVVLIEDGFIGSGETGRTTAHLTCALDDRYFELEKIFDEETARLAADSHKAAIDWIENTISVNNIDCNFKRVDGYLFLDPDDTIETLNKEFDATQRAGINTELIDSPPYINLNGVRTSLKFPHQGQFHILKYLKGLSEAFIKLGGIIYTETKAENITKEGATANGFTIKAVHIVVATNTPINDWVTMHTKQWPYRSYVIASKILKGEISYALWWDTGKKKSHLISEPYHYVRLESFDEHNDILIIGGEDHKTGQSEDNTIHEEDRYLKLETWAKTYFPSFRNIDFKWSGQVIEPIDSLAYIGKNPGDENIYIITGDSGNGMTHGTIGGILISDIITGKENPWIKIYDPSRITLNRTLDYLHEAGNMVAQYFDWFTKNELEEVNKLKPLEGGIFSSGMKKIAVYRDENNKLHACSAVCPHLGAILQWNNDEKTFDCLMHGSRFTTDGIVINGPAVTNLKRLDPTITAEVENEVKFK